MASAKRSVGRSSRAGYLNGRVGQQTAECVIVMGIVALVAVWIQTGAKKRFQWGVQRVTDEVFGARCLDVDSDGVCDCDDKDRTGVCDHLIIDPDGDGTATCNDENFNGKCDHNRPKSLTVQVKSGIDERGDANFVRRTTLTSTVVGSSVNEDARCLSGCVDQPAGTPGAGR